MQNVRALESSVLVLNKFFAAVHIVNAKRAFTLLFKESAEVVSIDNGQYNSYNFTSWVDVSAFKANCEFRDEDQYESIRTFSIEIRVPKIIRLVVYDKLPKTRVKFNRKIYLPEIKTYASTVAKDFPHPN